MKKQKILLAGATGYLGKYIVAELQKHKYPTRIVVRNKNKIFDNHDSLEVQIAEVTKPETLSGIMQNVDVVISTVGITRQKDGLTYMDVDYKANLNLLQEAKKSGVRKFIYVSAFNADKLNDLKMCKAKEKFVNKLKESNMNFCVIRPNGFFSDITEFLKMAKKGKAELFGKGKFKMNPIHGEDLAEICVLAIESEYKKIEVGGPEIYTHNEIAKLAFDAVNKKTRIGYIPEPIRKMILWFARTFTSSKIYGPIEFFLTVLAMDMIAPQYGKHTLSEYFSEMKSKI
ncbi:SDR family oxidoreductase [uncultured Draconibacterium sp.]|uniref:SDR family oxidoreductase n=1 Tax=uncultured Draconibacterium sp. TaxID=1573823 RepID=UPI002AA923CB|nr:SDR family oxidoreductase [uncultured Draconibacterium sp.]